MPVYSEKDSSDRFNF